MGATDTVVVESAVETVLDLLWPVSQLMRANPPSTTMAEMTKVRYRRRRLARCWAASAAAMRA